MRILFPAIGIALNCGSATVYGLYGDWARCVYWLCAAGLTAVVTFAL